MSTDQFNIEEFLRQREEEIISFLAAGPDQDEEAKAGHIAERIDEAFRGLWAREFHNASKIREFLRRLWNLFISLASEIDHEDERLDMLVRLLRRLQHQGPVFLPWLHFPVVWEHMPLFWECLRDAAGCQFSLDAFSQLLLG